MGVLSSLGSNLKSAGGNYLSGLVGNNKHAVVIVWDYRKKYADANKIGQEFTPGTDLTRTALKGGAWNTMLPTDVTDTAKTFSIQFNPASLKVRAFCEAVSHSNVGNQGEGQVQTRSGTTELPTLEMQVNLVFDRVNIEDAFVGDKFSTFASAQAIQNAVTAASKLSGALAGKLQPLSVQPIVEGFIAALRNPYTRTVSFVWNRFEFNGMLKNVSADYTMFSTSGRPVRANVALRLRQEMNKNNLDYWSAYHELVFKNAGGRLTTGKLL